MRILLISLALLALCSCASTNGYSTKRQNPQLWNLLKAQNPNTSDAEVDLLMTYDCLVILEKMEKLSWQLISIEERQIIALKPNGLKVTQTFSGLECPIDKRT